MTFKKHFLIFALAWGAIVCAVSDILLVSLYWKAELDTDKGSSALLFFAVPAVFAAANYLLIWVFSLYLVRRLRRKLHMLEGAEEYPFFRNFVLIPAAVSVGNTVLLLDRWRSVRELILKDEDRRIRMLFFSEPDYLAQRLSLLSDRLSLYNTLAVISAVLIGILKAFAYLFMARSLVRCYHRHVHIAYSQEVHQ